MTRPPVPTTTRSVPPVKTDAQRQEEKTAPQPPSQEHPRMERFKAAMEQGVPADRPAGGDPEDDEDDATRPRAIYATRDLTAAELGHIKEIEQAGAEFRALLDRFGMSQPIEIAKMHIVEAVMWANRHITS